MISDLRHLKANIGQAVIDFKWKSGRGIGIDEGVRKIIEKSSQEILDYLNKERNEDESSSKNLH